MKKTECSKMDDESMLGGYERQTWGEYEDCLACEATQEEVTDFILTKFDCTRKQAWKRYSKELKEPHNWIMSLGFGEWLKARRSEKASEGTANQGQKGESQ